MHGLRLGVAPMQAVDGARWPDGLPHCADSRDDANGSGSASVVSREAQARLARIVEQQIIPRLVHAHPRNAPTSTDSVPGPSTKARLMADEVDALIEFVLVGDLVSAVRQVEALSWTGASFELLCIELLAPAARRLGELWTGDRCDYATVSIALWRLQQLLRELGHQFPSKHPARVSGLRAMLVPAPGEDPSLGLAVAMSSFARAGWRVSCAPPPSMNQLQETAGRDWFDVAGLAVSGETGARPLARSIAALRKSSRNPGVRVLVGGPLLAQQPDLVAVVGADGTLNDPGYAAAPDEALFGLLIQANCG